MGSEIARLVVALGLDDSGIDAMKRAFRPRPGRYALGSVVHSDDNIRYINPPQAKEQEISEEEKARRATWDGYVDEE